MSQTDLLRTYLTARPGEWIPMPVLAEQIGAFAVHSRVSDLRRRFSMDVTNRVDRDPSGKSISYYRYSPPAQQTLL
jgi:hypothetical protein